MPSPLTSTLLMSVATLTVLLLGPELVPMATPPSASTSLV